MSRTDPTSGPPSGPPARRVGELVARRWVDLRARLGRGPGAEASREVRWREERRAAARRHHPDLGGEVADYLAALDRVDRAYGRATPTGATLPAATRRGPTPPTHRQLRRTVLLLRSKLPRGVPGARRYARL